MELAFGVALCLACGFSLATIGLPFMQPHRESNFHGWDQFLLLGSLSIGFGLGVFSIIFFLSRVLALTHLLALDVLVFAALLGIAVLIRVRCAGTVSSGSDPQNPAKTPAWFSRALSLAFAVALCITIYSAVAQTKAHPHGEGWDAFAIWNLHARFLFLGGPHWQDGFTPLLPWSHPDYPLLLPASIAHFWTLLGNDAPRVPAAIAVAFTFASAGLLFATLSISRGRIAATMASIALLTTPAFIEQGTWQYADVPLSFFILATIALLHLSDNQLPVSTGRGALFLAGVAAGLAAWTKNEGVLFLAAMIVARQWTFIRNSRSSAENKVPFSTHSAMLLAGCAPALVLIIYFKHWIAPPGDLFSSPGVMLQRMIQPARLWAVVKWFGKDFLRFGNWLVIPGTVVVGVYYALRGNRHGISRGTALGLILTLAGYFFIYLITPYDIYWHLRFSSARLFLQLWPGTLLLVFLSTGHAQNEAEHSVAPREQAA
jgi:hypothetical protein